MLQFASMENKFDSRPHNNGSKYYFSVKLFQVVKRTGPRIEPCVIPPEEGSRGVGKGSIRKVGPKPLES